MLNARLVTVYKGLTLVAVAVAPIPPRVYEKSHAY
jgi:hypothetical protein